MGPVQVNLNWAGKIRSRSFWLFFSPIWEGEENFVGDSEIIALGGASNETKDRPLG